MTDKKESILNTAIDLFSTQGYANTSTSRIAKEAGVSEALIFKHFKNKEGLLDAIVAQGNEHMNAFITPILGMTDPKSIIEGMFDFLLLMVREHADFWKLQMTLKYQSPLIAAKYHAAGKFDDLRTLLEKAYKELGYQNPKAETNLILMMLGSVFTYLLEADHIEQESFINFLKSKYNLS
ncbi:TetR/AcrR family transcriptional regulator [Limibacter armeniacum]|uniref:TetR/AcrR family transcriptional regulator n=1 Tax=Limibacter armeniacum TaxID=466084 RepID=UPI002FE55B21